jgi:hypothetical protein
MQHATFSLRVTVDDVQINGATPSIVFKVVSSFKIRLQIGLLMTLFGPFPADVCISNLQFESNTAWPCGSGQ